MQFPNNYLEVRSMKLFCACCQSDLVLRKTSIQQHVLTSAHKKNMVKRQTTTDVRRAPTIEEALSRTPNINTLEARTYRTMVSRAMLMSVIPLQVLDDNDACRIRHILEVGDIATLPTREVVDCIPELLKDELAKVFKELGSNCFRSLSRAIPAVRLKR